MREIDAVVIGGGVLGCFAARNLTRWQVSALLIEEKNDVCTGITRANTAVVYPGYDNKPGSLKAAMTVRGNGEFHLLCRELEVPFKRCGSLMVSFGNRADKVLRKKYEQGLKNGVPGLRLLSGGEAGVLEPFLAPEVTSALLAPSTGTVNPWELGIAAYENAVQNGCEAWLNTRVLKIRKEKKRYIMETDRKPIACRAVLNCAGVSADKIQELLFPPSVRLFLDGTDFLVMDRQMEVPGHIIFHESEEKGKGITAVPAVEGNLLLSSSKRPLHGGLYATDASSLERLRSTAAFLFPDLELEGVIRSFAAVRPNPYRVEVLNGEIVPDEKSIDSFVIENPGPGFWSLIGIKTPGLTCADQLGRYIALKTAEYLDAPPNPGFNARRKSITRLSGLDFESRVLLAEKDPDHGEIICQCEGISKGEILEAIRRGAVTVDGVKRRVGTGMGQCQGSRCSRMISNLLEGAGDEA